MKRSVEPELVGRTFDDFLFRPQRGVVESRRKVQLQSALTRRCEDSLPGIAANMGSVTRSEMGKTLALEGGVWIIHRGMSIRDQAREVLNVKRSHGHVVEKPLCLAKGATIREARSFTRQHHITGILIEET